MGRSKLYSAERRRTDALRKEAGVASSVGRGLLGGLNATGRATKGVATRLGGGDPIKGSLILGGGALATSWVAPKLVGGAAKSTREINSSAGKIPVVAVSRPNRNSPGMLNQFKAGLNSHKLG